jgi:hypothetical protein
MSYFQSNAHYFKIVDCITATVLKNLVDNEC